MIEKQLVRIEKDFKDNLSDELKNEFEVVKELILNESTQNALAIVNELMDWIDIAEQNLSNQLTETYVNLKKSDNLQLKLKFVIPLLSVIGINISTEYELKLNKIKKNIGTRLKRLIN